ncbi:TPA: DUF4354 family protein [Enterobacter cloacae]|nr:DUF4354 family protein [Enterobacter cloacae]
MRCNLIKAVCLTLAVSAAGTALAAQKASQGGITLFAEKQSQGSQWDSTTGEAQYMVSYKVTLNNASDKSIEPGKDNKMCFFLFGVLGIFRPKTTKCSGGPAVCGLQRGITFFEIPIWALFE